MGIVFALGPTSSHVASNHKTQYLLATATSTDQAMASKASFPLETLESFVDRHARQVELAEGDEASSRLSIDHVRNSNQHLTNHEVSVIAARCAPSTPSEVLVSIARVESDLSPLRIHVNGVRPQVYDPQNLEEATKLAHDLITPGRNIDLGLAQINSRNIHALDLSVEDTFDPCRNLAGAAKVLSRGYQRALAVDHADRPILQMAYSMYNTGSPIRGLANGYVSKVEVVREALR